MEIKAKKSGNKVQFFTKAGKQVFPTSIKGNLAEFANGEIVLF